MRAPAAGLRVVHVIQQLSGGGASRIALAQAASGKDLGDSHVMVSLLPPDERGAILARARSVPVVIGRANGLAEAEDADIIQLHFWNTPELYRFIEALTFPARIVLLCQVAGDSAPHVVTHRLATWADGLVATSPHTAALPRFTEMRAGAVPPRMVWGTAGFDRVQHVERRPNDRFTIGYIGTVDFEKMHRQYVALHSHPALAEVRVLVCGSGGGFRVLQREAAAQGVADRFDWRGYVEDVGAALAECDVLGYPLCPGNYSAAELILQEAAYCSVPAVVLPYGGAGSVVRDGETGLVARDEVAYTDALVRLAGNRTRCSSLGAGAAVWARETFHPDRAARACRALFEELQVQPKRERAFDGGATGAARFVASLGDVAGGPFRTSLESRDPEELAAADATIANSPPPVEAPAAGGILHYRRDYPDDPHLRLWSGLVLAHAGRRALAAAEFTTAASDPRTAARAREYLTRTLKGETTVARL